MQMIHKTDEFTDAVQGEGFGCARCNATTITAEAERSGVQFLNRVDDVQGVLTMNAQRGTSDESARESEYCVAPREAFSDRVRWQRGERPSGSRLREGRDHHRGVEECSSVQRLD